MRIFKLLIPTLLCFLLLLPGYAWAGIGVSELGDSLTAFSGFSTVWSPNVKVKNLRVSDNTVIVRTNATLSGLSWTPETVTELEKKVSQWVLGNDKGKVTVYSGQYELNELITDCGRGIMPSGKQKDLTDKNIALWPSHGLYFNRKRNEWIWQRATLWTTVEDLYSQEYVRLLRQMLENAGATVYMPRAGLEQDDLGESGMPRWTEGARYWLKQTGVSPDIWDLYDGDEYRDDMKCRALWVNSLDVPVDLCMALHTDGVASGNDSTIIGTLCIYTAHDDDGNKTLRDGRDRHIENRNLGDWIQTQITNDLRHIAPEWTRRQLKEANYCESRVPVVPSVLVELLSHLNMADMRYGLDPKFRMTAARAIYKGILRYLNGKAAVVQPLPVEEVSINTNGLITWKPALDSIEPTAKPTYYMVYIQENDGDWDVIQVDKKTQTRIEMKRGVEYHCYVVAGNAGGLTFPSPVVSAYISERDNAHTALIVDGFDDVYAPEWFADSTYAGIVPGSYACENVFTCAYIGQQWDFKRDSKWVNDDNCGWGACYRDHAGELIVGNTHDYSVLHGHVLRRMRISYSSATKGLARIDSTYTLVDYVCGRQRQPIDSAMQTQLAEYITQGGKVLLSSDHLSNAPSEWLKQNLHLSYYAAHATRSGRISSPLHRLYMIELEPNTEQLFTCHPEGIIPEGDNAVRMGEYTDMRCGAAVGWNKQTLVWGFPLEACNDFDKIYRHSVNWLLEDKE